MIMRGQKTILIFFSILAFFTLILTGCDKYTRYRVLSFFFDGVPHPDEPQKKEVKASKVGQPKKDLPPQIARFSHPPVEWKDDCSSCHGSVRGAMSVTLPPKDICLKCHSRVIENAFVHGPASVDCIVCHNVHESQVKTLVRKVGNPLCLDCHDKGDVIKAEPHKELKEEELVCLTCHSTHGGKDKFFLK